MCHVSRFLRLSHVRNLLGMWPWTDASSMCHIHAQWKMPDLSSLKRSFVSDLRSPLKFGLGRGASCAGRLATKESG